MFHKNSAGFTIVETAMAIVILGIIVLAVTGLFISTEKSQRSSLLLDSATRAGEQEVEALRNNSYTTLQPGSTIDFTNSLPAELPAPRAGTVEVSQPVDGLRRVDVTITYNDRGKTITVKLSSMIGQIGITQ